MVEWWLASPNNNSTNELNVNGNNGYFNNNNVDNNSNAVRPLDSLKNCEYYLPLVKYEKL